jgi:hypothetical protein
MKVEERNKARIKVLNRWTRMNTENYKSKAKENQENMYSKKKTVTLRCWKAWRKQIREIK